MVLYGEQLLGLSCLVGYHSVHRLANCIFSIVSIKKRNIPNRFNLQAAVAAGQIIPQKLNSSIEACETFNITLSNLIQHDESDVFPLYRLSFHWINPIGVISVLIVGTIVSFLTGARDLKQIDPELISPVIHR